MYTHVRVTDLVDSDTHHVKNLGRRNSPLKTDHIISFLYIGNYN